MVDNYSYCDTLVQRTEYEKSKPSILKTLSRLIPWARTSYGR